MNGGVTMNNEPQKIDLFGEGHIDNTAECPKERTNRQYQDSSFKLIFRDKRCQRLFLRDICKRKDWDSVDIENIELNDVFTIDMYNDVCFRAGNELIILFEHQSSINNNMPVRMLMYLAEEYKRLFKVNNKWGELFNTDVVLLPEPKFFVLYTGVEHWNKRVLKLSDAFKPGTKHSIDLVVPILTRDNASGVAKEYADFIWRIRILRESGLPMESAVEEVVTQFSNGYEISDILREKEDIMDWMTQHLTAEEKQAIIMENKLKEKERKVTQQVTAKDVNDMYDLLRNAGMSNGSAISAIATKRNTSEEEVRKILNLN